MVGKMVQLQVELWDMHLVYRLVDVMVEMMVELMASLKVEKRDE